MIRRAIYPGTFDPITLGHINILEKAAKMFDEVILAVASFTGKTTMFSLTERTILCRIASQHLSNVVVDSFDGLIVDYTRKHESAVMIRGMRAVSDFEYELALALTNKKLAPDIETVFLVPSLHYMYQSSSMIKQLSLLGSDLTDYVPQCVIDAFESKQR